VCLQESAAKLKSDYRTNRHALKRIRKISDWFVRHRNFCADNMRTKLCEMIANENPNRSSQPIAASLKSAG